MSILFQTVESTGDAIKNTIIGNPSWLVIGIGLFVAAVIVIHFLKNIIVNSVLGIIGWGILTYFFNVNLPFWPSMIVSLLFGLAGLGAMLVLAFLGIVQ